MDYIALRSEIITDPAVVGYAPYLPAATGMVAQLLNDRRYSMIKSRFVTARTVLAECGPTAGSAILDKLDAAKASSSALKWAMGFLSQDSGLDIGHPTSQAMVDQLVTAGVLTASEGSAVKNLALQPASRAEVLGLGHVNEVDVIRALA